MGRVRIAVNTDLRSCLETEAFRVGRSVMKWRTATGEDEQFLFAILR